MAYKKQNFVNGQTLTAENLNKMDSELERLSEKMDNDTENDNDTSGTSNAVLYIAQELTDEQKAQARENIGAKADGDSNVTIKDVQYYYDGDNESDKHEFVQGATEEYKPFVKIATIPDGGKVNLVGGSVNVKGENQWLDFYFDITQDMLSQSVEKKWSDYIGCYSEQADTDFLSKWC